MIVCVGIAGGSGAGKSTLAQGLLARLCPDAGLIMHDWYYRDQPGLPPEARARRNYDCPDALETERLAADLEALRAGQGIEAPTYDFVSHNRGADTRRIEAHPVVVVEGILVLSDPRLHALLDIKVFVDAPADLRFIRRLERDLAERGRSAQSVIRQYLEQVRPMHTEHVRPQKTWADLVVDGTGPAGEAIDPIMDAIARQRHAAVAG